MRNIYLIGMMGCGKTTCAEILAQRLGATAMDTDVCIVKDAGMSVSDIFAAYGEERFREMETDACRRLSKTTGRIIACGGGLPLREENRKLIRENGVVFFLNRDPGRIYDSEDMTGRPLAQQGREAFIARFVQREPLYREAAHHIIGDYSTPEETVGEILKILEEV